MAGKKRKKTKSLAETRRGNRRIVKEEEKKVTEGLRPCSELPMELLELIASRLRLKENIRFSLVCKRWHFVAVSARVLNRSPWLMFPQKNSSLCKFFDPSHRAFYFLDIPDLYGSRICYAKDGWLLIYRPRNSRVFFFNPFTKAIIKLPRFELRHQSVAFSSAPTSPSCIVFLIECVNPLVVSVSTCHPGAVEWSTVNHQSKLPFVVGFSDWNNMIFCGKFFYVLNLMGLLGVFDPENQTWNVLDVRPPAVLDIYFFRKRWRGRFMVEFRGELLVMYTCFREKPIIFKLDQSKMEWEKVKSLDGLTMFASFLSSHLSSNLPRIMSNSVYFPKVRFYGKRCISYSLDDCRYYPSKECHDWVEQEPFESIWIEPPEDVSTFV
ncbi:hypothetical protein HHK36_016808 [Tetracentron sinense]|uniref:F-box domain-containing protein n=1 Tax=Tetracentron sinense TaxID=13715 RepID=A0A834Z444_TETSI|nr:hypothetical protein HHK36_016808 [Tetracentron sinense]